MSLCHPHHLPPPDGSSAISTNPISLLTTVEDSTPTTAKEAITYQQPQQPQPAEEHNALLTADVSKSGDEDIGDDE